MIDPVAVKTVDLVKAFSRGIRVVDGVSLTINRGELFCLAGANGAGKTTLIKILCSLILPTSGEIFINGHNVVQDSEKARFSMGLVTGDERSFYWRLTGRQNMEFFASLYNMPSREAGKRIEELFNFLHIDDPDKRFQEYASGIKQRISIARSLLNNPDILFIDEVTKGLDPTSAGELRKFIKEDLVKKHGKTVFFSTHNLYEIEDLADRAGFIVKGRIAAIGTLGELRTMIGDQQATVERLYDYFINRKA